MAQAKGITLPIVYKSDPKGLKNAQKQLGGFGKQIAKLGGLLAGAFSVRAITGFAKNAITEASDLEESLNALNVSFGESAAEITKLGETAAQAMGVSQTEFNNAAVRFSAFADRVVGEGGDVAGFIGDVSTRATDFASVFNIDVAEALQVFQSGLSGEAEPLKRFGINLLQSEVQAYALREGLISVGEQMTEDQKVQARYGLLMEATAKTQGDFANTSDGLANSQRILQATFKDMQATVGAALVPAFATLTQAMLPIVEQLAPILTQVMEQLAPVLESVAAQIPGLLEGFMPLIPVVGQLATAFFAIIDQILPVFVQLIQMILPVILQLVEAFMPFIQAVLPVLVNLVQQLLPILTILLQQLFIPLIPVILQLLEAFLPLIELILPILISLLEYVIPILQFVAELFSEILIVAIGMFIAGIDKLSDRVALFAESFQLVFTKLKSFFGDIINAYISGFEAFVNGIIGGVNAIIRALNTIDVDIPDWVPKIGGKSFGINIATVPTIALPRVALAEGGIVDQPTMSLIGEAGPEAVIPLDKLDRMGGPTYNINVTAGVGDPVRIGEEVVTAIKRYERASGPVFASA